MRVKPSTLLAAVLLVGCSSGGTKVHDELGGVQLPATLAEGQKAVFDDGKVTTAEYQAAVHRFAECSGSVVTLEPQNPATGMIAYSTGAVIGVPGAEADSPAGQCYAEYLSWVELVWDLTDPAMVHEAEEATIDDFESYGRECLRNNGVSVPDGRPTFGPQLIRWGQQVSDLEAKGLCTRPNPLAGTTITTAEGTP